MAEVGSMSAENLHILTVEKLKAELLSHGLDTTGLKAVLVERLADYYQSLPIEEALAPTSDEDLDAMLNGNNGEHTGMTNSGKAVDVKVEGEEDTEKGLKRSLDTLSDLVTIDMMKLINRSNLFYDIRECHRKTSLTVYPVTNAELSEEALIEVLALSYTYGTRATPTAIIKDNASFLEMTFKTVEDMAIAKEKLQSWKSDIRMKENVMESVGRPGTTMQDLCGDTSRTLSPGDRIVCVAGAPPTITCAKLLEILPGYTASIAKDADGKQGFCYVEFDTKEAAQAAVNQAQRNLSLDGVRMHAFTIDNTPHSQPMEGGAMNKKRIKAVLAKSKKLRVDLVDIWATAPLPHIKLLLRNIATQEETVTDDAEQRRKNHLPHPNIWKTYLAEEMAPLTQDRAENVRHIGSLTIIELQRRLLRRENRASTKKTATPGQPTATTATASPASTTTQNKATPGTAAATPASNAVNGANPTASKNKRKKKKKAPGSGPTPTPSPAAKPQQATKRLMDTSPSASGKIPKLSAVNVNRGRGQQMPGNRGRGQAANVGRGQTGTAGRGQAGKAGRGGQNQFGNRGRGQQSFGRGRGQSGGSYMNRNRNHSYNDNDRYQEYGNNRGGNSSYNNNQSWNQGGGNPRFSGGFGDDGGFDRGSSGFGGSGGFGGGGSPFGQNRDGHMNANAVNILMELTEALSKNKSMESMPSGGGGGGGYPGQGSFPAPPPFLSQNYSKSTSASGPPASANVDSASSWKSTGQQSTGDYIRDYTAPTPAVPSGTASSADYNRGGSSATGDSGSSSYQGYDYNKDYYGSFYK